MSATKATAETAKAAWESLPREGRQAGPQPIQKITGGSLATVYKVYRQLQLEKAARRIKRREDDNEDFLHSVATDPVEQIYSRCKARADKVATLALEKLGTSAREILKIEGGARAHGERRQAIIAELEARRAELEAPRAGVAEQELKLGALMDGAREREMRLKALGDSQAAENRALAAGNKALASENERLRHEVEDLRSRLKGQRA
ncbi:MAG: hypothetical protein K6A65_04350 [Succinivibrionaceae bacterium]|nr:hypothetical protein [Succinivibrionaceae bacterium]